MRYNVKAPPKYAAPICRVAAHRGDTKSFVYQKGPFFYVKSAALRHYCGKLAAKKKSLFYSVIAAYAAYLPYPCVRQSQNAQFLLEESWVTPKYAAFAAGHLTKHQNDFYPERP
jgi:hypothetical protein